MNLNLKERKGITLIALVITIIVLLILAGVSIAMLTGQNGILTQAQNAKTTNENKSAEEKVKLAIMAAKSQSTDGSLELDKLTTEVTTNYGGQVDGTAFPVTVTIDGKSFTVDGDGNVELTGAKPQIKNKVKVGDFVNYSAGNWTAEDMTKIQNSGAKIAANNSSSLPNKAFQFGGFTEGSSKDGNATPYNSSYAYVTDKSTGSAVTGWRVFDVDGDSVTLISAGCPEDYYHPYRGYISEYILSGNTNSSAPSGLELGSKYIARDWSMYVNSTYGSGITATALTKTRLDQWYNKNYNLTSANVRDNSTFQKVYGTNNESLIDNYSYYWLASAGSHYSVYYVYPDGRLVSYNGGYDAFGVRVLVSLPSGIQTSEPVGTKTVTSRDKDYTYNVWNIK